MKRPPKVRIRVENQSAYLEHVPGHLVDEILGCDRRVFEQAGDGHITSHVKRVRPWEPNTGPTPLPEYTDDADDAVRIPRQLLGRLTTGLNERGIAFSEVPEPVIPSKPLGHKPNVIDILPWRAMMIRDQLKQVIKRDTTCIEYKKPMERTWLMAGLAMYYSAADILIVSKNEDAAATLARQLETTLDAAISVGRKVSSHERPVIHIRSSSSWFHATDDNWPVVFVDGISAATARQSHWSLLYMDKSLRFGFVQSRELRTADTYTKRRLEALFGPFIPLDANPVAKAPIVQMMAAENDNQVTNAGDRQESSPNRTVNGQAVESGQTRTITTNSSHRRNDEPKRASDHVQTATKKRKHKLKKLVPRKKADNGASLKRKRSDEWKNKQRNARITDVACAVRAKSRAKLTKLGCDALWTSLEARKAKSRPKVAIFVESAEHARELSSLLPKWTVLQHEWPSTADEVEGKDQSNEKHTTNSTGRVIVTEMYVTHRHIDADVLIVASGSTEGILRAKKNNAAAANGIGTRCVLNLADETHPCVRRS